MVARKTLGAMLVTRHSEPMLPSTSARSSSRRELRVFHHAERLTSSWMESILGKTDSTLVQAEKNVVSMEFRQEEIEENRRLTLERPAFLKPNPIDRGVLPVFTARLPAEGTLWVMIKLGRLHPSVKLPTGDISGVLLNGFLLRVLNPNS